MSLIDRLFASKPDPREALRPLYGAVVTEARRPEWYRDGGVADTVPGRFDMVSAALAGVLARMDRDGGMKRESALLTELFVHDMDGQLREMGIGDIVVGKHVGKLMGAMGGRFDAYRDGLAAGGEALRDAAVRNINFGERGDPALVARRLSEWAARLDRTPDAALLEGNIAA